MIILGLNTLGIVIETGLGIWIFSKAFPRREQVVCGWKEVMNEAVLHVMILGLILLNFAKAWNTWQRVLTLCLWIYGIIFYRCVIVRRMVFSEKTITVCEIVLFTLEFIGMNGLLAWNYWLSYVALVMVLFANMMVPLYLYKYCRCKLYQAYSWEVIYLATIQIVKSAYMVYEGVTKQQTLMAMNVEGGMHTYSAVLFPLLIYLLVFLLVQSFSGYDIIRNLFKKYKWRMVLTALIECIVFNYLTDLIGWNTIHQESAKIVVVVAVIIILLIFTLLTIMFRKMMIAEQRVLIVRNDSIEQQYQELRKAYDRNRCLIHDEKHRMQYIEECLENGDIKRAYEFVKKSNRDIRTNHKHVKMTGIPTIDFIINMKMEKIKQLRIDLQVQSDLDENPIGEADFVVLLGNLLDNAIEAAEKCRPESRMIKLHLSKVNHMFLLLLENSNVVMPVRKKEKFVSSKKESEFHGYGVESIKYITEKYDGEVEFTYDEKVFRVRINIQVKENENGYKRNIIR